MSSLYFILGLYIKQKQKTLPQKVPFKTFIVQKGQYLHKRKKNNKTKDNV